MGSDTEVAEAGVDGHVGQWFNNPLSASALPLTSKIVWR
jgi:hypothetical protein